MENTHDLESLILELSKYGKPSLMRMDEGGWHANVNAFVTGEGIIFKAHSDYNCKTPTEAVLQCSSRLHEFIQSVSKTKTLGSGE